MLKHRVKKNTILTSTSAKTRVKLLPPLFLTSAKPLGGLRSRQGKIQVTSLVT